MSVFFLFIIDLSSNSISSTIFFQKNEVGMLAALDKSTILLNPKFEDNLFIPSSTIVVTFFLREGL